MKFNKKKSLLLGAGALGIISLTAFTAQAYRGDYTQKGPYYSPERHEAMEQAFENNDYNAWKKLMEEHSHGRVLEVVTEDNFEQFAQAHQLAKEGKYEEADAIRQELGLRTRKGVSQHNGEHRMQGWRWQENN